MELFHPRRVILEENLFRKSCSAKSKEYKTGFAEQEMELSNRKWNYFTHLGLF